MKKRIFIAINLPSEIKRYFIDYQKQIENSLNLEMAQISPFRWTKKENLHITVLFLGYVEANKIQDVLRIVKKIAEKRKAFSLELNKILFGPPLNYKNRIPKMIWAVAETKPNFCQLKEEIESELISAKLIFGRDNYPCFPHITLARIRSFQYRQIEKEEMPEIERDISFVFPVEAVQIMESKLLRKGAEYKTLYSLNLKSRG